MRAAGYGAIWHGQKSWNGVAILARGAEPVETRRGLPGDPDDMHSRYIEAAINGLLVGCLYLPNGNPAPGPRFDYKLRWFERLATHARSLLDSGAPVVLAGDYNVMPTDLDVYKPERWVDDALFRPEVRDAYRRLVEQGWTDALRALHPDEPIYTFWDYFRNAFTRNAGLRIDHLLLSPSVADRLVAADVDREARGWEKASDHAPTWIELAAPKPHRRAGRGVQGRKAEAPPTKRRHALGAKRFSRSSSGLGTGVPMPPHAWMQTWSAPAPQWAWRRARIASSSPQATMASTRRSEPPSARSASVKPRRSQLST
jgi:exodeoxyribonuclease III